MSNDPLWFVPSVTRSMCPVFAFRHPKHRRFGGNWVLIARLAAHWGYRTRKRPCRPGTSNRTASVRLPSDCLVELVFVSVLIDISFVPLGWAEGRCDLRRLGGVSRDHFSALRIHASLEIQPNRPWFGARGS
jgi:hypothetical protein